jgi:outer membrane receptor for monomeric catechols
VENLNTRARLVYLSTPRSEVMIIYAVSSDAKGLVEQALQRVSIARYGK